jgi:predicted SAM-dependent methyltransferase|tara:strand:+ start:3568 stop:4098 length:531 start_codon:yes stop_codon:yes gene_type:complete
MNIEFGGGEFPRKEDYVQVDVRKLNDQTIVCKAWEVENHIKPNTVENIYSRHFFEHLTRDQAIRTLKAWYNICTKGAEITMLVPNMKLHIWQWLNWDKLSEKDKEWCLVSIYGWQRESDESAWDLHKSGYDFEKLKELIEKHHFSGMVKTTADGPMNDITLENQKAFKHLSVKFYK